MEVDTYGTEKQKIACKHRRVTNKTVHVYSLRCHNGQAARSTLMRETNEITERFIREASGWCLGPTKNVSWHN